MLVGERLGLSVVKVDRLRWQYYERWGFTRAESDRIRAEEGLTALLRTWKPYEIRLVEALVVEHRDCVFDFGAGFSYYDDSDQARRLRTALRPFRNIVLVLPSPGEEESIRALRSRYTAEELERHKHASIDFPRYDVLHSLPREVAKHILYTEGRTPDECVDELLPRLLGPNPAVSAADSTPQ